MTKRSRGFENPLPRTESPGLAPVRSHSGTKDLQIPGGHVRASARTLQGRPLQSLLEFLSTEYAAIDVH